MCGPLDARAAPRVFSHGIAINQRRLAHGCSKEMQRLMPVAPQDFRPAHFCAVRLSRNPTWQMLAEARSIVDICVEGSRIPAVQVFPNTFRRRRNFLILIPSCALKEELSDAPSAYCVWFESRNVNAGPLSDPTPGCHPCGKAD